MSNTCLQLKGSVVTAFILELYRYSSDEFTQQLQDKINQAPDFFHQSPLVISLDKLDQDISTTQLLEIISICTKNKLQPMAFRSEGERFKAAILQTDLVHLSNVSSRNRDKPLIQSATQQTQQIDHKQSIEKSANASDPLDSKLKQSRIITRPVRSGQQIYAEGRDLIVLSQVSAGAEVLADGNIHVYGCLRGRALAGVKGDVDARIFCAKLEAELISIAGNFMLSDALRDKLWKAPVQIYLDGQSLHVEAL